MINKTQKTSRVMLVILDGWGVAPANEGNAIELAQKPFFDALKHKYPYTELCAHGRRVGLPVGQPGNSEAGHLNLGAGRIVYDDALTINKSIKNGRFFKNPAFLEGISHWKKHKSQVHIMGLVTEKNSAHSSPQHWLAMIDFLEMQGVKKVFLHLFTDGRDSAQHAAIKILERFQDKINNHRFLKVYVASVIGRFYAMDRIKKWDNIEKAYRLLVCGQGLKVSSAQEAIVRAYNRKETDEFISPTVVVDSKERPVGLIKENDLVFFMNLRSDRARELSKAFVQKDFNKKNPQSFKRGKRISNLFFVALTDFGPDLDNIRTAYPSQDIQKTLPIVLNGLKQVYIAETEKYAHITFFFNGGHVHIVSNEKRIIIPSPDVRSYGLRPEMSANKICQRICKEIQSERPNFIALNFANTDMVGHTGNLKAAIKAVECVDNNLKKLVNLAQKEKYSIIVTADHGNAEEMIDLKTGEIKTTHTINPVPFILVSSEFKSAKLRNDGSLADVAPTILRLLGIKKPKEMKGQSLIRT
ncbi:phosphoglycerate mutase (2,3-diphosphoglycerate-independent) [Candidatus Parcubacteria bacterium 4484_255]|nr:MAG: phosphoglycerate mutase (2,3-diphosphoglycerate-independent) [Candidatus Parcubacteria bacterium 4484_255]